MESATSSPQSKLLAAFTRWFENVYSRTIGKFPERSHTFTTASFEPVKPLYTSLDAESFDELARLGFPGEYPFTRGIQPTMYRGRLWTMRQYAGFGTAEESNARYRYLLDQGQSGAFGGVRSSDADRV